MDLSRVHRIFGTLVRSTERDVIRAGVVRQRDLCRELPANLPVAVPGTVHEEPITEQTQANLTALGRLVAFARKGQVHDPVVQALVLGLGPRHVAATLGIKGPAARKRLQRAREKLRATLVEPLCSLP
jgi:DNA-directed RNA polymerase specialized sigma24 family protein